MPKPSILSTLISLSNNKKIVDKPTSKHSATPVFPPLKVFPSFTVLIFIKHVAQLHVDSRSIRSLNYLSILELGEIVNDKSGDDVGCLLMVADSNSDFMPSILENFI